MLDEDDDESLCEVQDLSQTLNLVLCSLRVPGRFQVDDIRLGTAPIQ